MTRIAIVSASAAVTRTLATVILTGGHAHVPAAEAEVILRDMLHPAPLPASTARILLLVASGATTPDSIACPIRPAPLQRLLASSPAQAPLHIGGGWALDRSARNLMRDGAPPIALTEKECDLLKAIASAYPHAIGRDALLTEVWGITTAIDTHTLETHIYRLRSKLGALNPPAGDIVTESGAYKLVTDASA